jgi:hypothetical protein
METEKTRARGKIKILELTCAILAIVLAGSTIAYLKLSNDKDLLTEQNLSEIQALEQQISNIQNFDIANLTRQIVEKKVQIANLTNQITTLNSQISSLQAQLTQNGTTELSTHEKIRDSILDYVEFNHPETAQFMNNLTWTGGRATPTTVIGAETYVYISNGWKLAINYPVVPNPLYEITADYSATSTGIPYRIIWNGSWQNWSIKETSYTFAQ